MASAACVTEKPKDHQNQQQQQQQQVLKCPRCHSSNTKFCYYNNYSLAQPRHFCKGCKRYWTRGGILRNVPVGGGCRKNKRIKKPLTSTQTNRASPALAAVVHSPNPNPNSKPNLDDLPSSTPSKNNSNHHLNPLFQSLLPQNPKYPRFVSRVSNGYDHLHPDPSALGLGFSSSNPGVPVVSNDDHNSNSIASRCPSIFSVGSTSNCTSDPTTASFLASRIQQQPRFLGFAPYEDVQLEGTQHRMDWNNNFHGQNDHNDHIKAVESSDLNSFLWNTTVGDGGDWLDPTSNIGSSLPSLILPKQPD